MSFMYNMRSLPDDVIRDDSTNIISVDIPPYPPIGGGIGEIVFETMKKNSNRIAQQLSDTDETETYADVLSRIIRTAIRLKERNLNKNDVVCLCSYNHGNACVPLIACMFIDVMVCSLDPSLTVGDCVHLIKITQPKVIFTVPESLNTIVQSIAEAELNSEVIVYGSGTSDEYVSMNDLLQPHEDEDDFQPVAVANSSDTAVIFFSSGTTGLPKGICINHKSLYHQTYLMAYSQFMTRDGINLSYTTSYWISSVALLFGSIMLGNCRVITKTFDPTEIWHLIEKYRITFLFLSSIQIYEMVTTGRPDNVDTSSLLVTVTGGVRINIDRFLDLRDSLPGAYFSQIYGCTELAGITTLVNFHRAKDRLLIYYKPDSCARPAPGFEYKVVDGEGNACGPNQQGELRIRTEFCLNGYYQQDSSSAFDENGWLSTGDLVYFDEDACMYVVGRSKEMLKYRTWHVPPAAVENVLMTHPAVKQCVVFGTPHELDGDLPTAVVILSGETTEEELIDFVADRLNDNHKLRGGVKFVESLPITPSGKFKRKEIREMFLNGLL